MKTLALRLAGPLQSWGDSSRFSRRTTSSCPTKSGILGMLAAACGYRRTDSLEELLQLSFGVRIDYQGHVIRDFQVETSLDGKKLPGGNSDAAPISDRYYLCDAVFLAAVEGEDALIEGIASALKSPAFPLYLGRRSCPPAGKLLLGTRESDLFDVLCTEPWLAPKRIKEKEGERVKLFVAIDAEKLPASYGNTTDTVVRDIPLSFNPEHRMYGFRKVSSIHIDMVNSESLSKARVKRQSSREPHFHDPLEIVGA